MVQKLTSKQIEEIRKLYQPDANGTGKRGHVEGSKAWLAEKFGVSVHKIRQIVYANDIPIEATIERFMKFVRKTDDGCWLWTGAIDRDGYGEFGWTQVGIKKAHHASYRLFKGPLPSGKPWRLHSCDVRSCVNPDHLFPGTSRDNIDDMVRKGRSLAGEKNHNHKLTWEQVREIRAAYIPRPGGTPKGVSRQKRHEGSQRDLASKYGVSRYLIKLIVTNRAWKEPLSL